MAKQTFLGNKLRRLRIDKRLSQVDLAAELGISASYLNLIEHDRRDLTVPLLLKISQTLKVDPLVFASEQDGQLLADIGEIMQDPLLGSSQPPEDSVSRFVSEHQDIAHAFTKLYQGYKTASTDLQYLRERLSQDSVLADSSFRLRTLVTSIMSLTEIMRDNADMDQKQRQEFLQIVVNDSTSLTETINEMLGFVGMDKEAGSTINVSPDDAVTDFIQQNNNYFEEVESAAKDLIARLDIPFTPNIPALSDYLLKQLNVTVEFADKERHDTEISLYDEERRHLTLSRSLPPSSVKFHLALLIGQLQFQDLLSGLVAKSDLLPDMAKEKGMAAMSNYFAGACLLPYDMFYEAAEELRYDIELLQQQFGASYEQICHRLTTLQKPEKSGVPFHLIRTDIAGNISKRFSASGLRIPRYGSACPRWVVHSSILTPGTLCTQISEMPDGNQYFSIARTVTKPSLGFKYPKRHYAISIGCEISHANRLIYADGMNIEAPKTVMPVGITCRLCDRKNCAHRAAPPPQQSSRPTSTKRNISPGIGEW
ncbi:short-chain fatty acyl-CoA regulator family protein [Sneathiella limimaris]|uniref:short-chain fatty acyl-CoA regulator family protein n=1 Tax=Sneathiella limimaris TaxID=1964213 RepID=UPI00146ECFC3|nr:short-chain fatty acyl-CoA regulator family protein [Sneathiella limimaris]